MKYLFILSSLILFSCAEEPKKQNLTKPDAPAASSNNVKADTLTASPAEIHITDIEVIDSIIFDREKRRIKPVRKNYVAITDHKEAALLLKGKVKFGIYNEKINKLVESDTGSVIYEVHPDKGKPEMFHDYGEISFIAYYPELYLLLCEGGHTSDYSYDMRTGDRTEIAGNPDYLYASKDGSIRLNGWFPGQECIDSYIQQRTNGRYSNIIELSEVFWKRFPDKYGICNLRDAFWEGNQKLYIKTDTNYYLVKLATQN